MVVLRKTFTNYSISWVFHLTALRLWCGGRANFIQEQFLVTSVVHWVNCKHLTAVELQHGAEQGASRSEGLGGSEALLRNSEHSEDVLHPIFAQRPHSYHIRSWSPPHILTSIHQSIRYTLLIIWGLRHWSKHIKVLYRINNMLIDYHYQTLELIPRPRVAKELISWSNMNKDLFLCHYCTTNTINIWQLFMWIAHIESVTHSFVKRNRSKIWILKGFWHTEVNQFLLMTRHHRSVGNECENGRKKRKNWSKVRTS